MQGLLFAALYMTKVVALKSFVERCRCRLVAASGKHADSMILDPQVDLALDIHLPPSVHRSTGYENSATPARVRSTNTKHDRATMEGEQRMELLSGLRFLAG